MLEMKPICENCGKDLPNDSMEAMVCTFECTFCSDCVTTILENVCPNCGGGFERRPSRPMTCATKYCLANYPVSQEKYMSPIIMDKFTPLKIQFQNIDPRKR
jgi:hypothetical protein